MKKIAGVYIPTYTQIPYYGWKAEINKTFRLLCINTFIAEKKRNFIVLVEILGHFDEKKLLYFWEYIKNPPPHGFLAR